jgi:adenine/guanine phosphoribosyltransferase-like PRPP-binding protein
VGGEVVEAAAIIELPSLHGRKRLGSLPLFTLIDIDVDE